MTCFLAAVLLRRSFYKGFNPTIFGGTDPYLVDLSKARIPLLRHGSQNRNFENSSFEGMFELIINKLAANTAQCCGVSQRLLSSYAQCLAKIQNTLSAIKLQRSCWRALFFK
jgi:hypothetical protein